MNRYARPALIIAPTRSGGTMLTTAMSNHPEVFCLRGEPLNVGMEWKGMVGTPLRDVMLLRAIGHQWGYKVGMAKLTYQQAHPLVVKWIVDERVMIIHLMRRNILRMAISQVINGNLDKAPGYKAHSFTATGEPVVVSIDKRILVEHLNREKDDRARFAELLGGMNHIELVYEEIANGGPEVDLFPEATSDTVCDFLGITRTPLKTMLHRINRVPLSKIVANWGDIVETLAGSEYEEFCRDEEWTH